MPTKAQEGIIKEIITHLNTIEEKIKTLNDGISETEDLLTVNKLDIINIKNDIEKIKMSMPEVSPETLNKLMELEKISGNSNHIDKLKSVENEIKLIKSRIGKQDQHRVGNVMAGLEMMNQRVLNVESVIRESNLKKHNEHVKALTDLNKKVEKIEKKTSEIKYCSGCGAILKKGTMFCGKCGKKVKLNK